MQIQLLQWQDKYPKIRNDIAILSTLYNQGEENQPHSNPAPNKFGEFTKLNYDYIKELLGISWI